MTQQFKHSQLLEREEIRVFPKPEVSRQCEDHSFELPSRIYAIMVAFFLGAIVVLATVLQRNMAVSYGIIFAFLGAFFAVPALLVKASPKESRQALTWRQFRTNGIRTATGVTGALEATVLVLALPFFIFCWATAVATIVALLS